MELSVVNSLLGIDLQDPEAETIGGYVINRLGSIPRAGVRIDEGNLRLVVEEAQPNRILKLRVQRLSTTEGAP